MSRNPLPSLLIGLVGLGSIVVSAPAHASQVFPGVLQEEADMPCVPTCLVCHTTNPGEATTWAKPPFTTTLQGQGLKKQDEESLRTAFRNYVALAATNPTVAPALAALKRGEDPANPGTSVCGPIYGCGGSARVAPQQAPLDRSAIGWTLGAIAVASLLRRRRST